MQKVVVIVGPTASGKTSLSIELAKKFNGEVISADSRQIYRGLDLGTGKVTSNEMKGVVHHLLDIREPGETYTAAQFVSDADRAIQDITSRNKLPIIAGGTFFYIDMLLGKSAAPDVPPNETLRAELAQMSTEELYARIVSSDPERAKKIDRHNRPRLIRALEIIQTLGAVPPQAPNLRYDALLLGIDMEKELLHTHIHDRIYARMNAGMIEEVEGLRKRGVSDEWLLSLGLEYRYITEYLRGDIGREDLLKTLETKTRQYAKRQMTWLKRDKSISWYTPSDIAHVKRDIDAFSQRLEGTD